MAHPQDHDPVWSSADPGFLLGQSSQYGKVDSYLGICCVCEYRGSVPADEFNKFTDYWFTSSPKWFRGTK